MSSAKRSVVLGSNSFAGRCLVARLVEEGNEVIGISRSPYPPDFYLEAQMRQAPKNFKFVQADLNLDFDRIIKIVTDFRTTALFDFAGQGMVAESWRSPEQWYTTNIVSKVKLHKRLMDLSSLEAYVRVSTPEVYGSQTEPIAECSLYQPSTPYAVSHAAIDMSLKAFHAEYGFPVVFCRFANFYGPGQQLYRIIPRAIIYALTGKKLSLHGGGRSIRAFIHGDDVTDGLLKAVHFGQSGEIYHFSPQEFFTIKEVVTQVCSQIGISLEELAVDAPDRPGKDHAYLMKSDRARHDLQWSDRISLHAGISKTIEWVRGNLSEIKNSPLEYIHQP